MRLNLETPSFYNIQDPQYLHAFNHILDNNLLPISIKKISVTTSIHKLRKRSRETDKSIFQLLLVSSMQKFFNIQLTVPYFHTKMDDWKEI